MLGSDMNKILFAREKIYNHVEDSSQCGWSNSASHGDFERYCIAKDTIQDTGESLLAHREKGFSSDIYLRYVEYYGLLQAIYMQQDAIQALHRLFMAPPDLDYKPLQNWNALRDLRNDTAGHPVGRLKRLNRSQIAYDRVNYMRCPTNDISSWESYNVHLSKLLDGYDVEAANILEAIWPCLETDCKAKHTGAMLS